MKTKFGHMPCRDCGERVVVQVNENETMSYTCAECGDGGYCRKGQDNYAVWLKRITPVARAAPEKKPAGEPAPKKAAGGTIIG